MERYAHAMETRQLHSCSQYEVFDATDVRGRWADMSVAMLSAIQASSYGHKMAYNVSNSITEMSLQNYEISL